MRVRRQQRSDEPVPEVSSISADAVGATPSGWDGLPMVAAAGVVIRAARAADLAAHPGAAA